MSSAVLRMTRASVHQVCWWSCSPLTSWVSSARLSSQTGPARPHSTAAGSLTGSAGVLGAAGVPGAAGGRVLGAAWLRSLHGSAGRLKKRVPAAPPPRELDLLRYDMKDLGRTPRPALYLGLAGLIPLLGPPLVMAVTETYLPALAYAQLAAATSALSFLGGARWGFALPAGSPARPDWINLANGVVPPLLAWVAVWLSDSITPAVTMVIMGLGVSLHYDLALLPTYPGWFKALRAALTGLAVLGLLGTLLLHGLYPEGPADLC